MEEKEDHLLESLLEKGEEYSKTTLNLLKLKALDKSVEMASHILFHAVITLILFMFLLMITIGVAIWVGEITGKSWFGFFAVAGFYGISAVVIYLFMGSWIRKVAGNFIITHMLK
jgi:hypothetical protein